MLQHNPQNRFFKLFLSKYSFHKLEKITNFSHQRVSKIVKPSIGSVITNVSKTSIEVSKPSTKNKDVDYNTQNQTLESIHACEKPSSEDNIEKVLGENQ